MHRWLGLVAVLALAFAPSCANGPNSTYEEFGRRVNTEGFGHKYAQPDDAEELVLGPGDTLDIQIAHNPNLSGAQPVRIEGVITAPFVGNVRVAGLTPTEIQEKLQVLLNPYIRDVTIQVTPIAIRSKVIYVYATDRFGALRGRMVPLGGDMTLIDLITQIGGVPFLADDCHVKLVRGDPRHPKVLNINVRDMIVNGYTAANVQLKPDDILWLQPTFFARLGQALTQVTFPLRAVATAIRDGATTYFFLQDGTLPRRGRNFTGP